MSGKRTPVRVAQRALNRTSAAARRAASPSPESILPFSLVSILTIGSLLTLVTIVFQPVVANHFITLDDSIYVTRNPMVLGGLSWMSAGWALSSGYAANWHPLTWLSHMADVELFGGQPGGHHFTSLVLHALTTSALFVALTRATGRVGRSACVAALFAVHPMRVESVA